MTLNLKSITDLSHVALQSMESPLDPVFANVIVTELQSTVVKELFNQPLVRLYMRNVDHTFLVVKEKDIDLILTKTSNSLLIFFNMKKNTFL